MRDYQTLAHIVRELQEIRAAQEDHITSGRAADHAEYRHVCGVIRGLTLAENIVNDLVQKMEKSDD
jgi:ribosomal protein L17